MRLISYMIFVPLSLGACLQSPNTAEAEDLSQTSVRRDELNLAASALEEVEVLREIANNRGKKRFILSDTSVSDNVFTALQKCVSAEYIDLSGTRIRGKGLHRLADLPNLSVLALNRTLLDDSGLAELSRLKSVRHIGIGETNVSYDGIKHLPSMTLFSVCIGNNSLGKDSIELLCQIPTLEEVDVGFTRVTSSDVSRLCQKLPKLRMLIACGTSVDDDWTIRGVPRSLESINLSNTSISDRTLQVLADEAHNIKHINVSSTLISDAGVRHLSICRRLTELKCNNTILSGNGLSELRKCGELKSLCASSTRVSDSGLEWLQHTNTLQYIDISDNTITYRGLHYLRDHKGLWFIDVSGTSVKAPEARKILDRAGDLTLTVIGSE
jgi:hypothetical protein